MVMLIVTMVMATRSMFMRFVLMVMRVSLPTSASRKQRSGTQEGKC